MTTGQQMKHRLTPALRGLALVALSLAGVTVLVGVAHASGGGDHGHVGLATPFGSSKFVGQVFNFGCVVAILVWGASKALPGFLSKRKEDVASSILEAERLQAAAREKFDEYERKLGELDSEMKRVREETIQAGKDERDRTIAEAEAKAARMRKETEFIIAQQRKQLALDMRVHTVEGAASAAQSKLAESVTISDQRRLQDEYLERLERLAANAGAAS